MARTPKKTQPSAGQDKPANRPSSTRTRTKAAKSSDTSTASKAEELVQKAQGTSTWATPDTKPSDTSSTHSAIIASDDTGGIKYKEDPTKATGIYEGIGGRFGAIAHAGKEPIKSTIGIDVFNKNQKSAMGAWKLMQYAVMTGKK